MGTVKFYAIDQHIFARVSTQILAGREHFVVEKLGAEADEASMPSYIPSTWVELGEEEPIQWAVWWVAAERREAKRQADAAARALAEEYGVRAALTQSDRSTTIIKATPKFFVSIGGAQYRRDSGRVVGGGRWDADLSKGAVAMLSELAGDRAKVDFVRERAAADGVKVPR